MPGQAGHDEGIRAVYDEGMPWMTISSNSDVCRLRSE